MTQAQPQNKPLTFVHTADIHFGMENYGRIDPKTGIHTRMLDFEQSLNTCIDQAIEHNVDFFLFCGDAYKTAHPTQTQQKLLLRCLLRLYKADIPAVIVVGNHDHPLSFGKANALDIFGDLPLDGFHVINKPTTVHLKTKNGPVNIVGIPWPTRNTISLKYGETNAEKITQYITQAVTRIIQDNAAKLDPDIPAVLAGHLTVSSGIFSGSEKRAIYGNDPTFMPSQLAIAPFDYVALGHLHRHQNLNPNGVPIVYAGSIDRIDFGERKEEKGFCLVSLNKKKTTYKFIEIPTRPFIQIEVTIKPDQDHTEQLLAALKAHDIRDVILKVLYHIPEGAKDNVDLNQIQRACDAAMYTVGIIPIRKATTRTRRFDGCKVDMDMETLLASYFDTRPELKSKKSVLLEKTFELMEEKESE